MPSSPKLFLFDVGNVVIDADHTITYGILEKFGVPRSNAELFYSCNEYLQFSRGNITGSEFSEALIKKYLKFPLSYGQIIKAHNEHIYGVNNDVKAILKKLPKNNVAFTTDTNEWQTTREKELIDLGNYSNCIFRSHEIHMLKTDEGLFPYLLKELGMRPEEILFIDDSIEKIKMAEANNIPGLLFKDAGQLSHSLASVVS